MVSEKSPRRSRAGKTGPSAEPASSAEPDNIEAVAEEITTETVADESTAPVIEGAAIEVSEGAAPILEEEKADELASAEVMAEEKPAEVEDPAAAPAPAPAAPTTQKSGTSLSGALAAGILGGLVSLAGAGAMQYAGYLPSVGAASTSLSGSSDSAGATQAEIAALKAKIETLAITPPAIDIKAFEKRLAALEAAPAPSSDGNTADVAPIAEKLAAVEAELARIQGIFANSDEKQQSMQTSLLDRLQSVEAEVKDPKQKNAVARAIAASGLKAAIDRGGSFVTELETYAGVAGDDPGVASLKTYAEKGVPTRAELVADFPASADAVLSALNKPDPNQGIVERLWSSALSLVKVRPVGQVEGETPAAFIARSEQALKSGDFETALAEWNKLPEEGRMAAPAYGAALTARIEIDKLVGATLKDAVIGAAGN